MHAGLSTHPENLPLPGASGVELRARSAIPFGQRTLHAPWHSSSACPLCCLMLRRGKRAVWLRMALSSYGLRTTLCSSVWHACVLIENAMGAGIAPKGTSLPAGHCKRTCIAVMLALPCASLPVHTGEQRGVQGRGVRVRTLRAQRLCSHVHSSRQVRHTSMPAAAAHVAYRMRSYSILGPRLACLLRRRACGCSHALSHIHTRARVHAQSQGSCSCASARCNSILLFPMRQA